MRVTSKILDFAVKISSIQNRSNIHKPKERKPNHAHSIRWHHRLHDFRAGPTHARNVKGESWIRTKPSASRRRDDELQDTSRHRDQVDEGFPSQGGNR